MSLSLPFVTASTTAQPVSFITENATSLGVAIARNLAVGSEVVFTGNATADFYINTSSSGCSLSISSNSS